MGRRTPTRGPALGAPGLADSVPPTPLGFGGPAPCELSLSLRPGVSATQARPASPPGQEVLQ